MSESLPERLALRIIRRNLPDIRGVDPDIDDETLKVVCSGLYQPLHAAIRAALDEAAKVARAHEEACLDPYIDCASSIARAIEALKG